VDNKEVGVDNNRVFNKNVFSDQKKPRFYLMWKNTVENVENPQSRMFIKKFFRAPLTQLSNHSPRFLFSARVSISFQCFDKSARPPGFDASTHSR
jgi:hypothetical protein